MLSIESIGGFKIKLIATNEGEVGISAIDFFSFCHSIMGYLIFLVLNNIVFFITKTHLLFYCFLGVIFISVSWELLENFYLDKLGIKFALRRDSAINAITDVCFFSSGGFYAMYNIQLSFSIFLVSTILFLDITITVAVFYSIRLLGIKRVFGNIVKRRK